MLPLVREHLKRLLKGCGNLTSHFLRERALVRIMTEIWPNRTYSRIRRGWDQCRNYKFSTLCNSVVLLTVSSISRYRPCPITTILRCFSAGASKYTIWQRIPKCLRCICHPAVLYNSWTGIRLLRHRMVTVRFICVRWMRRGKFGRIKTLMQGLLTRWSYYRRKNSMASIMWGWWRRDGRDRVDKIARMNQTQTGKNTRLKRRRQSRLSGAKRLSSRSFVRRIHLSAPGISLLFNSRSWRLFWRRQRI